MKKFFLMGLCFGIFLSCDNTISLTGFFEYEYEPPSDVEMPEVKNPYEIFYWIGNNMVYVSDVGIDDWQAPHESVERKKGDCEDPVILSMYYFQMFNYEPYMLVSRHPDKRFHSFLEVDENTWINFGVDADSTTGSFTHVRLEPNSIDLYARHSWQDVLALKYFEW
jgi:hypothetical protein